MYLITQFANNTAQLMQPLSDSCGHGSLHFHWMAFLFLDYLYAMLPKAVFKKFVLLALRFWLVSTGSAVSKEEQSHQLCE